MSGDLIVAIVALVISIVCLIGVEHENRRIDKANAILRGILGEDGEQA